MKHKTLIFCLLLFGAILLPAVVRAQVVVERSTEIITISGKQYYMHHVKAGETLYSISKVYEISIEEILRLNPEVDELGLQADMVIGIPVVNSEEDSDDDEVPEITGFEDLPISEDDEFGDGYIIHTVKKSEKTKTLLRRWNVSKEDFALLNPSVGSRVFVGQKVLIPVENARPKDKEDDGYLGGDVGVNDTITGSENTMLDTIPEENLPSGPFVLPEEKPYECYASAANASREYHVVLMVPLYLSEVEKLDTSHAKADKTKNTRAMKFLQFYEGFMMAVDSLTQYHGLRLDLTVLDVTENVSGANNAVEQLRHEPVDLIIGPFFSKSFAVVREFAVNNNILIVNPLSERETILEDAPNVVKLKPSVKSMAAELADLIRTRYPKAKVSLMVETGVNDTMVVNTLERTLNAVVAPEVMITNTEMLELITQESIRRKMGKRVLSTLEVEGQIFSTKYLTEHPDGESYFDNRFTRYTYSDADVKEFKSGLSAARDNVLVAYGEDIVFATKVLNSINKSAQKFPITLIGLPNWDDFDNLLVENLLNMNAVYFDDHFVDFNDSLVLQFVDDFRAKYESEPMDYAYEGFDVGWYFLNALMEFGPHAMECLSYYHQPLIHTRYYFNKHRYEDGLENRYWSVYQYNNQAVELKPILVYPEEE